MYTAVSRDSMPWLTAVYMVGHKKCHFRFYDNFGTCRLLLLSLFLSLYTSSEACLTIWPNAQPQGAVIYISQRI